MAPTTSCVICATPRSGSWLLCGLLASTGVAGRPHEWFVEPVEQRNCEAWNVGSFRDYLECVRWAATTPNGVAAVKVMWPTHVRLLQCLREAGNDVAQDPLERSLDRPDLPSDREVFERVFRRPTYVWLVRDDVDAQAASLARATRTGVWTAWGDGARVPPQPAASEETISATIREHNASWRAWFAENSIEPHVVRYEDLVEDPEAVADSVLRPLALTSPRARVLTRPTPRVE